jgi:anti-sigma-K factor RskA
MAKLIQAVCVLLLILPLLAEVQAGERREPFPPEVSDPAATQAVRKYWGAFEAYEYNLLQDGEKKFNEAWREVKKNFQRAQIKISASELESLQKSAQNYRTQLTAHQNSVSRPYTLLNLAQILALIGDHQAAEDPDAGTFARSEALALIKDIETNHRDFRHLDQALYLRASVLATMGRDDEALSAWRSLASAAQASIYGVYARIAIGDSFYKKDQPLDALRSYQDAQDILLKIKVEDSDYERVRLDYRLGWAAYRATELDAAVLAASDLLSPDLRFSSTDQKQQIQQDAVDLIGDSLFENNNLDKTYNELRRTDLAEFSGAIGLRTLKKYYANGNFDQAAQLASFLYRTVPLSVQLPEILRIQADAFSKIGKPELRIRSLEALAEMLPAQSLWRARNKSNLKATKSMESLSKQATELVAVSNYETALASGNSRLFLNAAALYENLIDQLPSDAQANEWRLRRAHCAYFSENNDEAAKLYTVLKTDYKVSPEILQIASYQLVLTNEKRWREAFAKSVGRGDDPYTDGPTLTTLAELEKSIDEFSSRFAGQSRSVDLLLVGASANRDMNRLGDAGRYWQRVLVSQPAPAQRGLAVRGLILTAMKIGSPAEVIEACRRYLKLEDWQALGLTIATELNGVLSAATLEQSKVLVGSGKLQEAGELMIGVAEEFPKVPERDRIYRDGAYQLAIGGEWSGAERAAQGYLQSGLMTYRGDMVYLLARAQEYQLRLHEAAKSYADLAEKFPNHVRAGTSAARSERLAVAEGDFSLAAKAASMQAERATVEKVRRADYARAAEYLEKDGDPNRALLIARKGQRASRTAAERYRAELQIARLSFKTGSEQEALDDLAILAKQIDKSSGKMPAQDFSSISGEVHVMLGDEAKSQFDDFNIIERGGDLNSNIEKKTEYFASLTSEYDRAATSNDPKWSSEARFQIGASAEALADEIASIPARSGEQVTLKSQSRYNATVQRLRSMAQKYHGANVLAARKNPSLYKGNEWVSKSAMRLSGVVASDQMTRHKEALPTAVQSNIPSDWSL